MKDIATGAGASAFDAFTEIAVLGNEVFFKANDGAGYDLWKSDGTAAGTVEVVPGTLTLSPFRFFEFNNFMYFVAENTASRNALFRTDGTIKEQIYDAGSGGSVCCQLGDGTYPINNGSQFLMANSESATGDELYISNGLNGAGNTTLLANINTSDPGSSQPRGGPALSGFRYFMASTPATGQELWRSDGSSTTMVTNLDGGAASGVTGLGPAVGGHVYFEGNDGTTGTEIWRTDGSTTERLTDINTGAGSAEPENFFNWNGTMYFSAIESGAGRELFKMVIVEPQPEPMPGPGLPVTPLGAVLLAMLTTLVLVVVVRRSS